MSYEEVSLNSSEQISAPIYKAPTKAYTIRENKEEVSIIENLTYVGRILTNIDFDKIEISNDCVNGLSKVDPSLFENSSGESLHDYYSEKLNKKRPFLKEYSIEDLISCSSSLLQRPLLLSSQRIEESCLKLFKHLLSYMGYRNSSKTPIKHACNFIKLCLKISGTIYDEAYVQVLKQLSNNPDEEKRKKAWNFLAILSKSFAPETKLYLCLVNFLRDEIKENPDQDVVRRCNYIIVNLYNTYNSRRKFIMSPEEIKYTEEMKPLQMKIYFFSGTYTTIPYESYTTLEDVKYSLMNKLKLKIARIPYYGLCEILDKYDSIEERILDEEEKLVDVIAMWDYDMDRFARDNIKADFKIYLKLLLHYGSTETDIDTITLNFYQELFDIIQGKYNFADDDISKLGALQIIAIFGNIPHESAKDKLEKDIYSFVPNSKLKKLPEGFWIRSIMEEYTKLTNVDSKFIARKIYLDHIGQHNFFQSHLFWVKEKTESNTNSKQNKKAESEAVTRLLVIKPNGISICDSNKEQIQFIEYVNIYHWGYNSNTFVIVLQDEPNKFMKFYYETYQVRTIYVIVQSYCYLIAQNNLQDLSVYLKNYVSNFRNLPKAVSQKETNVQGLRSLYVTVFKK